MAATGPIATFSTIASGSGYTNGTFGDIPLAGGSGLGALAQITVAGGTVSAVSLADSRSDRTGKNYQVADALTLQGPNWIGAGSGFSVTVGSLAPACENCIFGKIVPDTAINASLIGRRYCGREAFSNIQPGEIIPTDPYAKLVTEDSLWCGDGADLPTGKSFSSLVNQLPVVQGPGSLSGQFTLSAAVTTSVPETRLLSGMKVTVSAANSNGAQLLAGVPAAKGLFVSAATPGVGFDVTTGNGVAAAGGEGFSYLMA